MMQELWGVKRLATELGVNPTTLETWINTKNTPEPEFVYPTSNREVKLFHPSQLRAWREWYREHLATRDERKVRAKGNTRVIPAEVIIRMRELRMKRYTMPSIASITGYSLKTVERNVKDILPKGTSGYRFKKETT